MALVRGRKKRGDGHIAREVDDAGKNEWDFTFSLGVGTCVMGRRRWVAAVKCRWPEEDGAGVFAVLCMICIRRNGLWQLVHLGFRCRACSRQKRRGRGECGVVTNSFWKGTLVLKESRSDYAKFHPPISYYGI